MIHIDVTGQGPALVLLHGWGLHGGVFAPLIPALSVHHTVYNVDLPGHGRSAHVPVPSQLQDWAQAVLDEVPAAHWLGWSLGGLVAQQAALMAPQSVRSLAVIASVPCFVRQPDWPHGMAPSVLQGFIAHFQAHYADTVDRFLALDLMTLPGGQHAAAQLRDTLLDVGRPSDDAITTGGALLQTCDLRQPLSQLQVPSLWVAGERDRLASPAALQATAHQTPGAVHVTLARTGHAPFLGDTDAVVQALHAFHNAMP